MVFIYVGVFCTIWAEVAMETLWWWHDGNCASFVSVKNEIKSMKEVACMCCVHASSQTYWYLLPLVFSLSHKAAEFIVLALFISCLTLWLFHIIYKLQQSDHHYLLLFSLFFCHILLLYCCFLLFLVLLNLLYCPTSSSHSQILHIIISKSSNLSNHHCVYVTNWLLDNAL